MSMTQRHYTNVLQFWRAVETFNLPDLPAPPRKNEMTRHWKLEPGAMLPWETEELPALKDGKQWRHTLYFHVVAKYAVVYLLAELSGSVEFRDPVGGSTFLSGIALNSLGQPFKRGSAPA